MNEVKLETFYCTTTCFICCRGELYDMNVAPEFRDCTTCRIKFYQWQLEILKLKGIVLAGKIIIISQR